MAPINLFNEKCLDFYCICILQSVVDGEPSLRGGCDGRDKTGQAHRVEAVFAMDDPFVNAVAGLTRAERS